MLKIPSGEIRFSILKLKKPLIMEIVFFCLLSSVLFIGHTLFSMPTALAAHAPEVTVSLEAKVDKNEVTVGDPIHYTVTATMPKGIELTLPQLGTNLGEFEIQDYQITGPTEQEDLIIRAIYYTIAAYEVGSYHIPPLEIHYKTIHGEPKTISTEGIEIEVKAVAPEDAADIKDIKGPLDLKRDWTPYRKILLWSVPALIVMFLIFWGIRYYRKKKTFSDRESELRRPAHEIAYEELKVIWDAFSENNLIKEFYLRLSEIIRHYFSRRYHINALEATTDELMQELKNQPLHWKQTSLISHFLDECDLVKFAKYIPKMTDTEKTYQVALQIIEETKLESDSQQIRALTSADPENMKETKKALQG